MIQEEKEMLTERYFKTINTSNIELFERIKLHRKKVNPILPIVEFIIERLVAVTTLATQNLLWDAEIVYRSALETLIKLLFISSPNENERKVRLNEYWNELAEINSIKQSEQAKKILAEYGNDELIRLTFTPIILEIEKEKKLKNKWSKKQRHQLEQKWSFSEILSSLTRDYKGKKIPPLAFLAHSYRMASNVTHGDETGILIIRERKSRPDDQQVITDFSHYLRLLSDSLTYSLTAALATMDFIGEKPDFFWKLYLSMKDINEIIYKYQLKVFDDPDYAKYR